MGKEIRFCPNCGSTWVEPDTSNRAEIAFSGGNPNRWSCNDCGYTGFMPVGDPREDFETWNEQEHEKEKENYPREDLSFGKGYFSYVLYVTGPIGLVIIIYLLYRLLIAG